MSNVYSIGIAKWQISRIHQLKAAVFPGEVEYRAALSGLGAASCKDLNYEQAMQFISILEARAQQTPVKKVYGRGKRGLNQHLTQRQADRIYTLTQIAGWNQKRLFGYIKHTTGKIKPIQMLTNQEASNVILALQRIIAPQNHKELNTFSNKQLRELYKITKEANETAAS